MQICTSGEFWGWFAAMLGNYVFNGMDNWINKDMPFGQAFSPQYNPVVLGGNYAPGSNTWSNTQVSAQQMPGILASGQQNIANNLAGLQDWSNWQPFGVSDIVGQSFVGQSQLDGGVAGPSESNSVGRTLITGTAGLALSSFNESGNYLHVLPRTGRLKVYNRPYVNQFTRNTKIAPRGTAVLFGINQFGSYLDFRSGTIDKTQFQINTHNNILGSISPQFALLFMSQEVIHYLDGKMHEFGQSPTWQRWYNGMLEMTYPENYGVPYEDNW